MDAEDDDRFAIINHDPRFRKISQRARKVQIDKRFQGMFKEDSFKLKYTVDKRGRPVNLTSNENLRRFYELPSSEEGESSTEEGDVAETVPAEDVGREAPSKTRRLSGKEKLKEQLRRRQMPVQVASDEDDTGDDSDHDAPHHRPSASKRADEPQARPPLPPRRVDLARGQGNMASSSESESDSHSDSDSDSDYGSSDQGEAGRDLQWGELDRDAPRSGDQSARLALCNMDWDRVTASDLLVLFNSFKPTGASIHSVKIYPSDYGQEKMREEDARGPSELVEAGGKRQDAKHDRHDDDLLQAKLRKYQLQRLKYYYAVVDCDSIGTAAALYDHCDGMEYQSSSAKLDLRFIPADVTFDREPKEVAAELPDTALYKPMEFRTAALHQSRVELTWDETSHRRAIKTAEAFKKKSVEEMDVSAFLASSSDEDGEERWEFDFDKKADENKWTEAECPEPSASLSEDQHIAKYRALLKEATADRQTARDKQMEMVITWEPGLKDAAEELVKKKSERMTEATPWEKFLDKKKEKKKKQKGKKTEEQTEGTNQNADLAFSDDELPKGVDLNDPFFKDALKEDGVKGVKTKVDTKARKEEIVAKDNKGKVQQNKSELELLFMDEDDSKKHFHLKQILENEKTQSKKAKRKKRRRRQQQEEEEEESKYEDDFQIDVRDDRFKAMFTSHLYAVDPSDPQFKRTKASEALLAERRRQRQREEETGQGPVATPGTTPEATPKASKLTQDVDAELSMLIKSVKNKTDQFKERKLKRQKVK